MNLNKRTYHALIRGHILTVGNLREFYLNRDRYRIRNIGEKSLNEILKALEELPNNSRALALVKKAPAQLSSNENQWAGKSSQVSIDVLNLSPAIRGMLKIQKIQTVDDLIKTPDSVLLDINLIGPKKLAEIRSLLVGFVNNSSETIVEKPIVVEKKTKTWANIIEDYISEEKDVYFYILISRFGFSPKTLEEISTELGVTRERVRQIQEGVAVRYINFARRSSAMTLLGKIEKYFRHMAMIYL